MALYLIGDIQGCDQPLQQLLDLVDFSPSRDTLFILGDMVNRGPDSLAVVHRLMSFGDSAVCLLGNHDLHFLAVAHGVRPPKRKDTLTGLLTANDRAALVDWIRHQRLAHCESIGGKSVLMVHAGVLPAWGTAKTLMLAREVETVLQSPEANHFYSTMYGNEPSAWSDTLQGMDRLRTIVNALTRLRFCSPQGVMEMTEKGSAIAAPPGLLPWFDAPGRRTKEDVVAFGHWSTLGRLQREDVYSLDLGCVWGGHLAALRIEDRRNWSPEQISVKCPQMVAPGD